MASALAAIDDIIDSGLVVMAGQVLDAPVAFKADTVPDTSTSDLVAGLLDPYLTS